MGSIFSMMLDKIANIFKILKFFIDVPLIYNAVLVSGE